MRVLSRVCGGGDTRGGGESRGAAQVCGGCGGLRPLRLHLRPAPLAGAVTEDGLDREAGESSLLPHVVSPTVVRRLTTGPHFRPL